MIDIEHFLITKAAAGLSADTLRYYRMFVGNYLAWCRDQDKDAQQPDTVAAHLAYLRKRQLSANTVSGCYRALSVWFKWLVSRHEMTESPLVVLQRPKLPRLAVRHVTLGYYRSIYGATDGDDWTSARDRAIMLVLLFSGLRAAELVGLYESDLRDELGVLVVNAGKGKKARQVPYHPTLPRTLQCYLEKRPAWNGPELWLSNDGAGGVRGPMTVYALRGLLEKRSKDAGLPYFNPHAWRHGYAMLMLNAGMGLSAVSATMGHSSTALTEKTYAHWQTSGLLREYGDVMGRINGTNRLVMPVDS